MGKLVSKHLCAIFLGVILSVGLTACQNPLSSSPDSLFDPGHRPFLESPDTFSITASTAGDASVQLSWDTSARAASYSVRYRLNTDTTFTSVDSVTSPYTLTGLTNASAYVIKVVAINSAGESETASVSATPVSGVVVASQIVFSTQPSVSTVSSTAFAQQPIVTIKDAQGNVVTTGADSTKTVTLSLTTGSGVLAGTLTKTAVAGVADFSGQNLAIDLMGADKVITASAPITAGTVTAVSNSFAITAGAFNASTSTFTLSSATVVNGSAITMSVTPKDAAGNSITGTITFAASGGTSAGTIGATSGPVSGIYTATFTGTSAGTATTLTASVNSTAITQTRTITVSILPALAITTPSTNAYMNGNGASGTNKSDFQVTGTCNVSSATVTITLSDAGAAHTVTSTTTCNGSTFTKTGIDASSLNDGVLKADASMSSANATQITFNKDTTIESLTHGMIPFTQIAGAACGLTSKGMVYCWGYNVGDNTSSRSLSPSLVHGVGNSGYLSGITSIAMGGGLNCALKGSDGSVYCWGGNTFGAMGDNTNTTRLTPVQVHGVGDSGFLTGITNLSTNGNSTCGLKGSDGSVYCWGYNNYGQLGDGTSGTNRRTPVQVHGVGDSGFLTGMSSVTAGPYNTCAVKSSDGSVFCWGRNDTTSAIGDGTFGTNKLTPVQVHGVGDSGFLNGISKVTIGSWFACAVKTSDGSVYCWGYSVNGQLGNNSGVNKTTPVQVHGVNDSGFLTGITSIMSGVANVCALKGSDGSVYCWGSNSYGQIGDNTSGSDRFYPVQVHGVGNSGFLTGITSLANTTYSPTFCALKSSNGSAFCWGYDQDGEAGDHSTSGYRNTPVQVKTERTIEDYIYLTDGTLGSSDTTSSNNSISGYCSAADGTTVSAVFTDGTHTVTASTTCTNNLFTISNTNLSSMFYATISYYLTMTTAEGNVATTSTHTVIKDPAPTLSLNSVDIVDANYASYSITGSCSPDGSTIAVSVTNGTITDAVSANSAVCTGGFFSLPSTDYSSIPNSKEIDFNAGLSTVSGYSIYTGTSVQKMVGTVVPNNQVNVSNANNQIFSIMPFGNNSPAPTISAFNDEILFGTMFDPLLSNLSYIQSYLDQILYSVDNSKTYNFTANPNTPSMDRYADSLNAYCDGTSVSGDVSFSVGNICNKVLFNQNSGGLLVISGEDVHGYTLQYYNNSGTLLYDSATNDGLTFTKITDVVSIDKGDFVALAVGVPGSPAAETLCNTTSDGGLAITFHFDDNNSSYYSTQCSAYALPYPVSDYSAMKQKAVFLAGTSSLAVESLSIDTGSLNLYYYEIDFSKGSFGGFVSAGTGSVALSSLGGIALYGGKSIFSYTLDGIGYVSNFDGSIIHPLSTNDGAFVNMQTIELDKSTGYLKISGFTDGTMVDGVSVPSKRFRLELH